MFDKRCSRRELGSISSVAPAFAAELIEAFIQQGHPGGSAVCTAQILRCTYDASADAGYIYLVRPAYPVSAVHNEAAPVRETIPFTAPHWFNVDIDHEGNPFGVELLSRPDVIAQLRAARAL